MLTLHGTVTDAVTGKPLPGANLDFWQTDSDGSLSRDPGTTPDDEGVGKTLDLFELEVDQENLPKGVPGYVAFTVDLPDRSVKEGNRRNNYDGFYYYVLDPAACATNTGQNGQAGTGNTGTNDPAGADTDGDVVRGGSERQTGVGEALGVEPRRYCFGSSPWSYPGLWRSNQR